MRLDAEERLKNGQLKVLVATGKSLELGIDIVTSTWSARSHRAASHRDLLQRVGRSGHTVGGLPKGRIFPLTRDDLLECSAMVHAVKAGELDRVIIPEKPLDVLAQQIVAESAAEEWDEDTLFALMTQAYPYRNLTREEFQERSRSGARLHHASAVGAFACAVTSVNHKVRGRRARAHRSAIGVRSGSLRLSRVSIRWLTSAR